MSTMEHTETAVENNENAVCLLDPDGTVLACSSSMLALLGKQTGDVVQQPCHELFPCSAALEKQCPRIKAVESGVRTEATVRRGGRDFIETAEPLFDKSGILLVVVLSFRESTVGRGEMPAKKSPVTSSPREKAGSMPACCA